LLLLLRAAGADDTPVWAVLASTALLQAAMVALAGALGPRRWRVSFVALFGPRVLSTGKLFGWGAVALFASIAAGAIFTSVAARLSDGMVPPPLPEVLDLSELPVLTFAAIVLVGPTVEELFFRGFLFAGLLGSWGLWAAAATSAALFAAVHLDIAVAGPAFLSGMAFALVHRRTGSLWPAILAHTSQNAIAFGLAA
jgi:membrane protease YdiL (CAAX protease family)